jgi:hypothetical protein
MDETAIQALVTRLARPRGAGGHVIERAAILAAGPDSTEIEAWILAHAGEPEGTAARPSPAGVHSRRLAGGDGPVRRFVFPRGVL